MHLQMVTFDRVFSVLRKTSNVGDYTEFGFQVGEEIFYEARVFGHPDILVGAPILVALASKNSWRNIFGWKNLTTNEVMVYGKSAWHAVVGVMATLAMVSITGLFFFNGAGSFSFGARSVMAAVGFAATTTVAYRAAQSIGKLRAYALLKERGSSASNAA